MRTLWAILTFIPLTLSACSSDEAPTPEEPITPQEEGSEAAPSPDSASGAESATPSPEAPGGELPGEAVPPASDTETVGELTDSPAPSTAPGVDEAPMPSADDLAQTTGEEGSGSGKTVTRVVTATKLNVRSGPSRKASVVRQLTRGDEVQAVIKGKFAKIGEGEYVRAKYLAANGKGIKSKGKKAKARSKAKKNKKKKNKAKKAAPQ